MDKRIVTDWCNMLKDAWLSKDLEKITYIFAETSSYYEDPFSKPGITSGEIRSYWDEIIFQDISGLLIEPILIDESKAILHWYLDYRDTRESTQYVMDGIYAVEFDSVNRCISFRQWWVIKE